MSLPSIDAFSQAHRRLASDQTLLPPEEIQRGSRGLILNAALRLFGERGYGGTSVRDIAAVASVQPATMYAYFPSKQHVLAEIIKIGHQEHHRRIRGALLESTAEPSDQLRRIVRAHVLMHATYPMLAVVANAELHALSAEFAADSLALRKQSEQVFIDVIARGSQRGEFRVGKPLLAIAAIGGMGIRVAHWFSADFGMSAEEVAETYAEFALTIVGFAGA